MHTTDIESNITTTTTASSNRATTGGYPEICSDACCAKLCLALTSTLLLSPFAICDLYYATSDDACVNQNNHGLTITMHSYLLASGAMMFIFIGGMNFSICVVNLDKFKLSEEIQVLLTVSEWILKLFGTSWLILGCVLLWAYTDLSKCSQTTHDYLFARFIIGLVFHMASIRGTGDDKK